MDLEQFVIANEPVLRLLFFLGVFAVVGVWEVVAPRRGQGRCDQSPRLARRAGQAGCGDAQLIQGGMTAWRAKGWPVVHADAGSQRPR